jgi:hypothetical protein
VLDKPVPIMAIPRLISLLGWVVDSFGNIFVAGTLVQQILLESLILAQDERWRRA